MSLPPDRVKVLTLDVDFRKAPAPVIAPDRVWLAEDPYVSVVDDPREIAPAYVPEPKLPDPEMVMPPPESAIVVDPVNVLVPDNVNVPAPVFVSVPVPVAIAPATVAVPTPSIVRLVFVPEIPFESVNVEDASI